MERVCAGDSGALQEILQHYWPALIRYARRLLGSQNAAEDVAQQSFMRLWERRAEWRAGGSLPSMRELVEGTRAANQDGLNLRFIGPATMPENVKLIRDAGLGFYV
jgi:hypothetical protein